MTLTLSSTGESSERASLRSAENLNSTGASGGPESGPRDTCPVGGPLLPLEGLIES